jgi:hypothetical protein
MQLKILKSFNYGSVSDPQKAIAGNTMESDTMEVAAWQIEKWIRLGWAVGIDATELGI